MEKWEMKMKKALGRGNRTCKGIEQKKKATIKRKLAIVENGPIEKYKAREIRGRVNS